MDDKEAALDSQIERLARQVDRMQDTLDTGYVRKDVFVEITSNLRADYARLEEGMKWLRRQILMMVFGAGATVAAAYVIAQIVSK